MDKKVKPQVSSDPSHAELDVAALLKKIQGHLVILERKIDNLGNKPQDRPFKKSFSKPFSNSKPFRPYGQSQRYGGGDRDENSREGGFPQRRPFKKYQSEESRSFGQKKKAFPPRPKDRGKPVE